MRPIPTLLRRAEHKALSNVTLSGQVLDLGGEKGADYLSYIKGAFAVTAVNLDKHAQPDLLHDLELPLPLADASYDHVLLVNVLEHVFRYRELLAESIRVVRPGGSITIVVPFLFPVHPSPRDYWRLTDLALRMELEQLRLSDITIVPLGNGIFAARYVLLDRLLPYPLRLLRNYTARYLTNAVDWAFGILAHTLGKKYNASDYALGYLVTARRPLP